MELHPELVNVLAPIHQSNQPVLLFAWGVIRGKFELIETST
jgi:hypothetical protein